MIRFSCRAKALQADKRAVGQQLGEGTAISEGERGWRQFSQGVEHERPGLHMVVRDFQAGEVNQAVAEQQDIQVQCARPPAFVTFAALIDLDGL